MPLYIRQVGLQVQSKCDSRRDGKTCCGSANYVSFMPYLADHNKRPAEYTGPNKWEYVPLCTLGGRWLGADVLSTMYRLICKVNL